jgi:hypothetical protein
VTCCFCARSVGFLAVATEVSFFQVILRQTMDDILVRGERLDPLERLDLIFNPFADISDAVTMMSFTSGRDYFEPKLAKKCVLQ